MSVGDIKGFRRRLKVLEVKGHMPKRASVSVAVSVQRERERAMKAAKIRRKK